MLKRIREKLKSTSAFSLSETLMAVLLLTIVFTAVSGGVVVMQRNYSTIVVRAEQQTTLATAVAVVSADLESATKVKCNNNNIAQCFYCNRRNMYMTYVQGSNGSAPSEVSANLPAYDTVTGSISVKPMKDLETDIEGVTPIPLLSAATEVFSSGRSSETKMRTVLSQITVHDDDSDKIVDYFEFTLAVPAKGAAVNEVQTVYVRPYNDVEIVS
ncbi:MAG: hypothetical protein J6E44_02080 [Lachnospiraceae bacterium]|nr:hypothetical protein [Lachnospiraceae bacterium]